MPDEKGETRRERNPRFGIDDTPEVEIPEAGWQFWEWYWTLSARLRRVRDSVCDPIPPSEFQAWCKASGTIVRPSEYAILCAMDDAFCDEMNRELRDYNARMEERRKLDLENK